VNGHATKPILMIAYYFPPAGFVGVYRTLKFAKYLPGFGWAPRVLTTSNGRFTKHDETLLTLVPADVPVHRSRGFEALNEGTNRPARDVPRRTLASRVRTRVYLVWNWFARPDPQVGWVPGAFCAALRLVRRHGIHHVYISGMPFSSFLVGVMLKRFSDVRVVVDYRDPWTQGIGYRRRTPLHGAVDRWLERRVVRASDVVISNTRFNNERMASEFGAGQPREKFVAIHNGYDAEDFESIPRGHNDRFTITYAGAFYYSVGSDFGSREATEAMATYSPLFFFEALQAFLARRPETRATTRVRFMGTLGHGYDPIIKERGLDELIERLGYIDYDEHLRVLRNSDALLLVLSRGEKSRGWIPSKFFQYLGSGNPILGMVPRGEVRSIIEETGCGVCVEPDDVDGASRAIEALYDAWSTGTPLVQRDARAAARYERRNLTARLAAVLEG
jgi:glycosyltransferase involved in cell wall biosynthesis